MQGSTPKGCQEFFFSSYQCSLLLFFFSRSNPFVREPDKFFAQGETLFDLGGPGGILARFIALALIGQECQPAIVNGKREGMFFTVKPQLIKIEFVIMLARKLSFESELHHCIFCT